MKPYLIISLFAVFLLSGCPKAVQNSGIPVSHNPNLPDLIISDYYFDNDNYLNFKISNEGDGVVPKGKGEVLIFANNREIRKYELAKLIDQDFRQPGMTGNVKTDIRYAGKRIELGFFVDPKNEIAELNEFQNTLTRTTTATAIQGADIVVSDLLLNLNNELIILVDNYGSADSANNMQANFTVSFNNKSYKFTATMPSLKPTSINYLGYWINPNPPIQIPKQTQVDVSFTLTDLTSELDNTNNYYSEILNVADDDLYAPYKTLLSNSKIQKNLIWYDGNTQGVGKEYSRWTAKEKDDLKQVIISFERGLFNIIPSIPKHKLTLDQAWEVYLLHIAQTLWIDVNNKVSWKLVNYSDTELLNLLNSRNFFTYLPSEITFSGSVTSWNPTKSYNFLKNYNIIDSSSELNTMLKLTDWMRGHLIHWSSYPHSDHEYTEIIYDYRGYPPVERMIYRMENSRKNGHETAGCWGVTSFYQAILRSVNIPVKNGNIVYGIDSNTNIPNYHSATNFITLNKVLPHGDNIYTGYTVPSGAVIPSVELFYSAQDFENIFVKPKVDCENNKCNPAADQALYNHVTELMKIAYKYRTDYLFNEYSFTNKWSSLRNTLKCDDLYKKPVKPCFSDSEVTKIISTLDSHSKHLGGGNFLKGIDVAKLRYKKFIDNK